MQEEYKADNKLKTSLQPDFDTFAKATTKRRGWSFRSLFLCCDPQNIDNEPVGRQKHTNSSTTAHYSAGDPSSFVTTSKQKECAERIRFSSNPNSWVKNGLFLLGKGSRKMICKMTKTDLNTNRTTKPNMRSTGSKPNQLDFDFADSLSPKRSISEIGGISFGHTESRMFTRQEIFSLYSHGIRVDKSDWNEITPECIAQHIANKLSGKFVIDALSGYGGNAIQFARRCPYVIGVEIEAHKVKKAEHNSGIYHVNHKIDLIHADFFSLKKLFSDVVFLAPSEIQLENSEKFSLQTHLAPNLTQLIKHSLTLSKSLCIMLPPCTSIEELAAVFCDVFDENPEKYDQFNYSLELDLVYLDETLVSLVVLFGEINTITTEEKRDILIDLADLRDNLGPRAIYSENFCNRVLKKVGFQRSLSILLALEEESLGMSHSEGTMFDAFLEYLKEKSILTPEIIYKLQQSDLDSRTHSSLQSSKLAGQPLQWNSTIVRSSGPGPNGQLEPLQDPNSPRTQTSSKRSVQEMSNRNSQHIESNNELGAFANNNQGVDSSRNSLEKLNPQQLEELHEELNEHSPNHSDMVLSSYSMKSDAMLDSFSDHEAQYMLSYDGEENREREASIESLKRNHSAK